MSETEVAEEAADLLFEADDVAELIAEITGEDVSVEADETAVTFDVAGEKFTCEADEDDEVVESASRVRRNASNISASAKHRPMRKR
jgi:hypothetical protein